MASSPRILEFGNLLRLPRVFVCVCTPLKFVAATGSPVRPLALGAQQPEVSHEGAMP
jgi:kynurenine formamidase